MTAVVKKERPDHFEVYLDSKGKGRYRKKTPEGQVIEESGVGYSGKTPYAALSAALRAVVLVDSTAVIKVLNEDQAEALPASIEKG